MQHKTAFELQKSSIISSYKKVLTRLENIADEDIKWDVHTLIRDNKDLTSEYNDLVFSKYPNVTQQPIIENDRLHPSISNR